ncbi:MAG: patatin-like phospholipase family protein [Treponema sp.]|nr:patatin-like phospholipase family protein [Treponema sp.]
MVHKKSLFAFLSLLIFTFSPLVSEEPLGLVLCGNSVRAFSHIGVLRALEKNDIKPDFIVANSIGAMIGILYSSGFSPDELETIATQADLASFFRTVQPDISGKQFSHYYNIFLSALLPEAQDISDLAIPVIIPTMDPETKKRIIFKEGNVTDILKTLFSYCYMTEPVAVKQDNETKIQLEENDMLDSWTVNVAEQYSRNLIVSTAILKTENEKNPNAVLIGSNTTTRNNSSLVNKLMASPYRWIRNDIPDFSFYGNSDYSEIIRKGEATVDLYFALHPIPDCTSLTSFLFDNPDFYHLRNMRRSYTEKVCVETQKEMETTLRKLKENPELTENSPAVEMKNFFFAENLSTGLYTFLDFRPLYIRTGIRTNFFTFWRPDADLLPEIKTTLFSDFNVLTLQDSVFYKITEQDIILGMENQRTFYIPGIWSVRPYATGEMMVHYENNVPTEKKFLVRTGIELFAHNYKVIDYSLNPYVYLYSTILPFNLGKDIGYGGTFSCDLFTVPYLGTKYSDTFRYQKSGKGIVLNKNDGYRGLCPSDKPEINQSSYLNLFQMEYFWYIRKAHVKATETLKLEGIKAGLFYDSLAFREEMDHTVGFFIRPQILINDVSIINLEFYLGYDSTEKSPVLGFNFTQRW